MKKVFTIAILVLSINAFAQISTDSLLLHLAFKSNYKDFSGNCNSASPTDVIFTTDRFGNTSNATLFNGISSYIELNNNNPVIDSGEFTISCWFYIAGTGGGIDTGNVIFSQRDDATGAYKCFIYCGEDNGNIVISLRTASGSSTVTASYPFSDYNNWHHYVATLTADTLRLYLDNILVSGVSFTQNGSFNSSIDYVHIGKYSYAGSEHQFFNGKLDDFRIYNRAISQSEVSAFYSEYICYQIVTVTDTLIINAILSGYSPINYQNTIKIYPNPANDHITIDFGSNYSTINNYTLKITNSLAQIVYSTPINQQQTFIDLDTWSGNGFYFVHLIDANNNTIDIKKIVIQ